MFTLKEKLTKIKSEYWQRGREYMLSNKVQRIKLTEADDGFQLNADVNSSGHNSYHAELTLKISGNITHYCSCPSHNPTSACKHIAALVLTLDNTYGFDETLKIIRKENDALVYQYNSQNGERKYTPTKDNSNTNGNNKINIFSQLQHQGEEVKKGEDENIYKIKLNFVESYYESSLQDIEMCLYQCKRLKNGKFSTGKQVYRNSINKAPQELQKYSQFIKYSSNRWDSGSLHITFCENPEYFLKMLFDLTGEVYNKTNKLLDIEKAILPIKIKVKKQIEGNYVISLVLISEIKKEIPLLSKKIIKADNFNSFACLTRNRQVFFFESDMPLSFIRSFVEKELLLDQDEFDQLKQSSYFQNIIEQSVDTKHFGLIEKQGNPQGKFIVEIGQDYDEVKIQEVYSYGESQDITYKNSQNCIHFLDAENIITRNYETEKDIQDKNKAILSQCSKKDGIYIKKIDETIDSFFDILEKYIDEGYIVEYKQETKRVSNASLGVKVDIKSGIDYFEAKTTVTLGEKELKEYAEIIQLLRKNNKVHKKSITLKNGMTLLLKEDLQETFQLLGEIDIDIKDIGENIKIEKHNIGLLQSKNKNIDFHLDSQALELKKSLSNFSGIKKVMIPKNIKVELRDYQQVGYNWINFLEKYNFSGILADDMGLGKTVQALSLLQKIYNTKTVKKKTLIVCPTSLVYNWKDEAQKFTPDLQIELIQNSNIGFLEIKKTTQVIIGSYGIISKLAEENNIGESFYYLILDESQNIKNPVAKRTKNICKITAKYRLALSGTPIENNLTELWSVFHFLMPGFLGNLNNFRAKYIKQSELSDLKKLSTKVKPFILRRTKEEVLQELPPKQTEVVRLEMGEQQKAFYSKLKIAFKLQINKELKEKGLNKSRFQVLDSLLKLRQACLVPELVNMEHNTLQESIKLKYLEENIDDMIVSGHNLLIFSQFTGFLKYVKEIFNTKNIAYNYIDGKIKSLERKRLVDDFNNGDTKVFIISLKAGGTGLNLTKADYVIHMDPWWNPAVENQATDRAHRMGQEKTVFVKKLIVKDSIEEKILELQEKKKKIVEDMFSGNFSGSLTKNDIDFIFE